MTEDEFTEPLQYLEGALGGPPKEALVRWLVTEFKKSPADIWARACYILAHGNKPAHFLVGQDFVLAISKGREQEISERKKKDAAGHRRQSEQYKDTARPIKESTSLFRRTLVDTIKKAKTPGSKRWLEDYLRAYDEKHQEDS